MTSRFAAATLALALFHLSAPQTASALTNDNGIVVFTQADALAGGVTPGDDPGFPVTISVPGSYRLGSTLTVTTAVTGIFVTGAEVTIDFAGNRLIGSGVGTNGIEGSQRALTVRNGTIRAFADYGILSYGGFIGGLIVDGMRIAQNGNGAGGNDAGVAVNAPGARIVNSVIVGNKGGGISCNERCYVRDNTVTGNGAPHEIRTEARSMVLGNLLADDGSALTKAVIAGGVTGWGDNAVHGTALSSDGALILMSPNSCRVPSGLC